MAVLQDEVARRRTSGSFLTRMWQDYVTEKLLLFGGAIQLPVRSRPRAMRAGMRPLTG